jgi:hypothetical protein
MSWLLLVGMRENTCEEPDAHRSLESLIFFDELLQCGVDAVGLLFTAKTIDTLG